MVCIQTRFLTEDYSFLIDKVNCSIQSYSKSLVVVFFVTFFIRYA